MRREIHQRLDDDQRQYNEIMAARQAAAHAAQVADNNLNSLIAVIQKEREARKEITKDLTRLRAEGLKLLLVVGAWAGLIGAFAAGMMNQITGWLWAVLLAGVSSVWATLAAWWNS